MYEADVFGGLVWLFVMGKNGNVGFAPCFSSAGNLLFDLC